MRKAVIDDQIGAHIGGCLVNMLQLQYADDTTLIAELLEKTPRNKDHVYYSLGKFLLGCVKEYYSDVSKESGLPSNAIWC